MLRYSTLPYHTIPELRIVPCRVEPDSLAKVPVEPVSYRGSGKVLYLRLKQGYYSLHR